MFIVTVLIEAHLANLAYQVGWTTLLLKWENDEQNDIKVKTPSNHFKWNQLGELYKYFNEQYVDITFRAAYLYVK